MTDCPDLAAWEEYREGRLSEIQHERMRVHLKACSECRGLLTNLRSHEALGAHLRAAMSTTDFVHAKNHVVHMVVGLIAASIVAIPPHRVLRSLAYPLLVLVVGLLVFVLLPAVPEWIVHPRNGARRWINLGVTDFQPSEVAKIAYVLAIARYLRFRSTHRRVLGLVLPFLITLIPMGLVLVEPDLGTALLFVPTLFAMLVAAGCFEQPAVFRNNDLPGVMLASAAQRLIHLYAVKPFDRAIVLAANRDGYRAALDLHHAGVVVDHFVNRLLQRPIAPERRRALMKAIMPHINWRNIQAPSNTPAMRGLIHLILSTPEYQLS